MNRREFLRVLAALGVATTPASLREDVSSATVNAALRKIARTPWWAPVVTAWTENPRSSVITDLCSALEVFGPWCCNPGDVAVARLVLGRIQAELPQWFRGTRESITFGRRSFPSDLEGSDALDPVHAVTINWATSGPGIEWPETYCITNVKHAGIWVATASRDTEDAFGCTDHAVGWISNSVDARAAAKRLVMADWKARLGDFDQSRWENIVDCGLMSDDDAFSIANEVWK